MMGDAIVMVLPADTPRPDTAERLGQLVDTHYRRLWGSSGRSIMDSTFSIALGETVVIGTSRLKGDQALIALLTAARKPGAAR